MNRDKFFDEEWKEIKNSIKENKGKLNLVDILRIHNYKVNVRIIPTKNWDDTVNKINKALEKANEDILKTLKILTEDIDGIGIPIASTLLSMRYPEEFAIIDINCIKAILKKHKILFKISIDDYPNYNKFMKEEFEKEKGKYKELRGFEFDMFKRGRKISKKEHKNRIKELKKLNQ
jgi:hypothetical protein